MISIDEIIQFSIGNAILSGVASKLTSLVKMPGFTGRGSISQVHDQVFTKFKRNIIKSITNKTFGKLLVYDLTYSALSGTINGFIDARNTNKDLKKHIPYFEMQF